VERVFARLFLCGIPMAKVKFNDYTQVFMQSVAILVGLAAIIPGVIFVKSIMDAVRGSPGAEPVWQFFILAAVSLIIGVYFIFVSRLMLKDFSARAVKHLCIVLSLFLIEYIFRHLRHLVEGYERKNEPLYDATALFVPLLVTVIFYFVCEKVFTRLTKGSKKLPID
jgi:hypothetical protein